MDLTGLADRFGDKPAVVIDDEVDVLTYAELEADSNRIARILVDLGLEAGDGFAAMLDNSTIVASAWWAALRAGFYYTPINWHLTASEVAFILRDCGARALIVHPKYADIARTATEGTGVVVLSVGPSPDLIDLREAMAATSPDPLADRPAGAPMFYSSGTTGRPKGVRAPLTGRPLTEGESLPETIMRMYEVAPDTRYLSTGPLYHSSPPLWSFGMHTIGATAVIMSRFDPELALRLIQNQGITTSQWVPTMFHRLLALPSEIRNAYDLSGHRTAYHAAAPCPVPTKRAMIEWWGPILTEFYAATEGGTTMITSPEWLARPGSVGRCWTGGEVHILDPGDRHELPAGQAGLVYFKALPTLRFEYFNDPEKTRSVYHGDLVTAGDIGYLDDDGYLFLVDRQHDMIISGGVNIYPREIEHVLQEHPRVVDVAVLGTPDPEFGESVTAVVEPDVMPADEAAAAELRTDLLTHARAELAGFKVPKVVDFVAKLPRDPNGKLYKRRLRDEVRPVKSAPPQS